MTSSKKKPGKLLLTEKGVKHESIAGTNMVNAVKKNAVKHFVFSSLSDIRKGSAGKFTGAIDMNNEVKSERLARQEVDGYTGIAAPGLSILYVVFVAVLRSSGSLYAYFTSPCTLEFNVKSGPQGMAPSSMQLTMSCSGWIYAGL